MTQLVEFTLRPTRLFLLLLVSSHSADSQPTRLTYFQELGIDLGTVTFSAYFQDTYVGPLTGDNLVLPPESTVAEHLSGRIVPQSGSDLDTIGTLFSNFLAGENQTLSVVGDSVQPTGSGDEVTWLSTAFKTLTLSVVLPGQTYTVR